MDRNIADTYEDAGCSSAATKKMGAILEVTKSCIFRCKTCYAWKVPIDEDELTIEEWKKCINSLSKTFDRNISLFFGGGEPLLKEGILNIVNLCAKDGYYTTVTTNGFVIDREMAKKIVDSGLNDLVLSLNSHNEEVHDFLKGTPGAFSRLMKAIDYIVEFRKGTPRIMIGSLITEKNLDDLIELANLICADERLVGICFQAITTPFYTNEDNIWYTKVDYRDLWPQDKIKVKNIIGELIRLKEAGYKILTPISQLKTFVRYYDNPHEFIKRGTCHLGYRNFSIGSKGDVFLCFLMEPIGNIRNQDFAQIWNSERARQTRERIKQCKKNCQILVNCWFEEE